MNVIMSRTYHRYSQYKKFAFSVVLLGLIAILSSSGCTGIPLTPRNSNPYTTFLIDPGGSSTDRLVWSPQGNQLAVSGYAIGADITQGSQITILDISTRQIRSQVTNQGQFIAWTWSPEGRYLVFFAGEGAPGWKAGLWITDTHGLTAPKYLLDGLAAAWAPTGELAVYRKDINAQTLTLSLYDFNTQSEKVIFQEHGAALRSLGWSSDGKWLAFIWDKTLTTIGDVYVLDPDDGKLLQTTTDQANLDISWSPIGEMVARNDLKTNSLYITKADGSCEYTVTDAQDWSALAWAPDGKQIAYVSGRSVYLFDLSAALGGAFPKVLTGCP